MIQLSCIQLKMHLLFPQKRIQSFWVMYTFLLDILCLSYYDIKLTILEYCDAKLIYLMLYGNGMRQKKVNIFMYIYVYKCAFV